MGTQLPLKRGIADAPMRVKIGVQESTPSFTPSVKGRGTGLPETVLYQIGDTNAS